MHWLFEAGIVNALVACGLAVIAYAVGRLAKRPAVTHALWVLVLLKLLSPPLVDVTQWPHRTTSEPAVALRPMPAEAENVAPTHDPVAEPEQPPLAQNASLAVAEQAPPDATTWPISETLVALWIAGAAIVFVLSCVRIVRFHRLVSRAAPADDALRESTLSVAQEMSVRRAPRVRVAEGNVSPLLWPGLAGPTIVMPRGLLARLSDEEVRLTLAHELAHLVRRDHWVRWVELTATALYWWHPLVWIARGQLRAAEEECCDHLVLHHYPDRPRPYGEALLKIADWVSGASPSVGLATGIGGANSLQRRIRMIVNYRPASGRLGRAMKIAAVVAAVVVLPLSSRGREFQGTEGEPSDAAETASDDAARVDGESDAAVDEPSEAAQIEDRYRQAAAAMEEAELKAFKEYVATLEDLYRQAETHYRVAAPGGTPEKVAQFGYEVEMARAELARRSRASRDAVRGHYQKALEHAQRQVEAATTVYKAGRGDLDSVSQAQKNLLRAREAVAEFGRGADVTALEKHIEVLQGIFDRMDALYRAGAAGSSADRQATAGFELARAKAELAEAKGDQEALAKHRKDALRFAERRAEAVQAAFDADRVDLDTLIQAQKDLLSARRAVNALKREN